MAEWLKARASKACIPLRVSGVRIPLSPPVLKSGLMMRGIPENSRSPRDRGPRSIGALVHLQLGRASHRREIRPKRNPPIISCRCRGLEGVGVLFERVQCVRDIFKSGQYSAAILFILVVEHPLVSLPEARRRKTFGPSLSKPYGCAFICAHKGSSTRT